MFCPQCKSEYREGFTTCADCGVALVEALPDAEAEPDQDEDWATVLESGDPALLAMAHSLLDAEGITARFPGEGLQSLFGVGPMGAGFNVAIGPAAVQVPAHLAEKARELLALLDEPASEGASEEHEDAAEDRDGPFPEDESPLDEAP